MFHAQVIADSLSPEGHRLTSIEATFPTRILAEMNTHGLLSKNASSTRAMPIALLIAQVEQCPYEPVFWGKNQSGMQAREELEGEDRRVARLVYDEAILQAIRTAKELARCGLHKQDVNTILMPFSWTKQLLTGTQWANFFALRTHADAHPAMQRIARLMYLAYRKSEPVAVDYDQWHLPYVLPEEHDLDEELRLKISVARCARVSYWDHEGQRKRDKDVALYDRLLQDRHMSPFAHQATPYLIDCPVFRSNFTGWLQHRKLIAGECIEDFNPSEEEIASWQL